MYIGLTHHDNAYSNRNSSCIHDKKKKTLIYKKCIECLPKWHKYVTMSNHHVKYDHGQTHCANPYPNRNYLYSC